MKFREMLNGCSDLYMIRIATTGRGMKICQCVSCGGDKCRCEQ